MTEDNDDDMIDCPLCGGTGYGYSVGDCDVSKEQYDQVMKIVPDACNVEGRCTECGGDGRVFKEEEYDPSDDLYDSWRDRDIA